MFTPNRRPGSESTDGSDEYHQEAVLLLTVSGIICGRLLKLIMIYDSIIIPEIFESTLNNIRGFFLI